MLGGQILLGRKVQAFTRVSHRSERRHLRSTVAHRATWLRSNWISPAAINRPDVLRGLVDGDERPAVFDQLSFLNRVPEFGFLLRVSAVVLGSSGAVREAGFVEQSVNLAK